MATDRPDSGDGYRYPFPPHPEGWFAVATADELGPHDVLALRYFDRDLVTFRDADGGAVVLDAICPHLGAHLGHGGMVDGGIIRCPFHGWAYGPDGACVDVPGSDRPPVQARLRTYPVIEWGGLVLVHHHPHGAPPTWRPDLPDLDATSHYCGGRRWRVRVHVQDVAENGFDVAHIATVHRSPVPELVRADADGTAFLVETTPQADCPSRAYLDGIDRILWGLGLSMNTFRGAVEGRVVLTRTPIDAEHTEIGLHFWPSRLGSIDETEAVGALLGDRVSSELEQDIPIWEHKHYLAQPLLVAGDGPIGTFRRWARQFYPA